MTNYHVTTTNGKTTIIFTLVKDGTKFRCFMNGQVLYSVLTKKAWLEKIAKYETIIKVEKA